MNFDILFVQVGLIVMLVAFIMDKIRQGVGNESLIAYASDDKCVFGIS